LKICFDKYYDHNINICPFSILHMMAMASMSVGVSQVCISMAIARISDGVYQIDSACIVPRRFSSLGFLSTHAKASVWGHIFST
jgi:hypothetical protein